MMNILARMLQESRIEGECLVWTGACNSHGYGHAAAGTIHRIAYGLLNGPIPTGMCILHTCDNRKCFRDSHLYLGTKKDNTRDRFARNPNTRNGCGSSHYNAKLSEVDVLNIIVDRELGLTRSCTRVAKAYGVSNQLIANIWAGRKWQHLRVNSG